MRSMQTVGFSEMSADCVDMRVLISPSKCPPVPGCYANTRQVRRHSGIELLPAGMYLKLAAASVEEGLEESLGAFPLGH